MRNERVKASMVGVPAIGKQAELPSPVERAGEIASFAWDQLV